MQGMMEYVEKPIHKEVTSATRQPGGVDASSWWLIGFKPCPTGTVHMIPVYCLATSVLAEFVNLEVPYGSQVPSNVCLPRVLDHLWVLSHFTNLDSRPVLIGRIAHHDLPGQPATPVKKRSKNVGKGQKRLKSKKEKARERSKPPNFPSFPSSAPTPPHQLSQASRRTVDSCSGSPPRHGGTGHPKRSTGAGSCALVWRFRGSTKSWMGWGQPKRLQDWWIELIFQNKMRLVHFWRRDPNDLEQGSKI